MHVSFVFFSFHIYPPFSAVGRFFIYIPLSRSKQRGGTRKALSSLLTAANGIAARKSPFKIKEGRTKQNRNAPGAPVDVAAFLSVWGVCILNRFNIDILAHNADIVKTAGRKLK